MKHLQQTVYFLRFTVSIFNLTVMIEKCGEYRSLFRISISAFTVLR